jgi:hypothetical protein
VEANQVKSTGLIAIVATIVVLFLMVMYGTNAMSVADKTTVVSNSSLDPNYVPNADAVTEQKALAGTGWWVLGMVVTAGAFLLGFSLLRGLF